MDDNQNPDEDTLKILLATDIHLGYNENHPVREDDSFVAFEEILKHAVEQEVDFILLGGDLFHDSKPSTSAIVRCSELIRRYCFGDKSVSIEFLSDQSYIFKNLRNPIVNYEDPNINVSIPIFSIHGNHDDPTGSKATSVMDIFSSNGLINYFGYWTDLKQVQVAPILLTKGETNLALYGLSHIHDQRLSRLFRDGKVSLLRPQEEDVFHLFVLHQNRAFRGANNYIPETSIPDFIDLAVWGHEHDCRIMPEEQLNGVYITQPGSSVATSLSEGESKKKHVGLLKVKKCAFELTPIPLKSVRPFIFETIRLEELSDLQEKGVIKYSEHTERVVSDKIDSIIERIKNEREAQKLKNMLPLIRIVLLYHDEQQQINAIRFSQSYVDVVANPEDMILQKPIIKTDGIRRNRYLTGDDTTYEAETEADRTEILNSLVNKELEKDSNKKLQVLSVVAMGEAIARVINNDDGDAIADIIEFQMKAAQESLSRLGMDEHNFVELLERLNKRRMEESVTEKAEVDKLLSNPKRSYKKAVIDDDDDDDIDNFHAVNLNSSVSPQKPARGRGSRGPRVNRGTRGQRGSRAKKT